MGCKKDQLIPNSKLNVRVVDDMNLVSFNNYVSHVLHSSMNSIVIVALDGTFSDSIAVHSGVLQGMVLGPLMFLLYINDITEHVNSPLRLFPDDCLLYRIITTDEDAIQLQHDLDQLHEWETKWQLRFNVTKCTIMRFTRSLSPIIFNYKLNNHNLGTSNQHSYLGVILDNKLSWSPHISNIAAKANRTLNFWKRNLSCC